eukprot:230393_1
MCDIGGIVVEKGTLTAGGGAQIIAIDKKVPVDCDLYTDDNNERGFGLLPFCDVCSGKLDSGCTTCRDGKVLIEKDGKGECVEKGICNNKCSGKVIKEEDDGFRENYCKNPKLDSSSCKSALSTVFPERYIVLENGQKRDQASAQSFCESTYRGNLATLITDEQVQTAMTMRNNAKLKDFSFWIGLNDKTKENKWVWESGGKKCKNEVGVGSCNLAVHWWYTNGITEANDDIDCAVLTPMDDINRAFFQFDCNSAEMGFFCDTPDRYIMVTTKKSWQSA